MAMPAPQASEDPPLAFPQSRRGNIHLRPVGRYHQKHEMMCHAPRSDRLGNLNPDAALITDPSGLKDRLRQCSYRKAIGVFFLQNISVKHLATDQAA